MRKKNYAYVNKDMLIWARLETPFHTTELVELACPAINAKNLDAWEKGEDLPSISEAKKLATLYKIPFAAFYLSEEPSKKIKRYTDRRTLKGCYTKEISYKLWSEIRRIESNRDSIVEYATDDINTKPIPVIKNNNSTEIASSIRKYLGLTTPLPTKSSFGSNPFNYYRNIIERNGIIVAQVAGVEIEEMNLNPKMKLEMVVSAVPVWTIYLFLPLCGTVISQPVITILLMAVFAGIDTR